MAVIIGTSGDDLLHGTSSNDTISGGAGNDTIYAGDGNDGVFGGGGDDIIFGEGGNDVLFGDGGDDYLDGGDGDDILYGGTGDDTLIGGAGNNTLYGEGGHDLFLKTFGEGVDVIFGGTGVDTLNLIFTSDQLSESVLAELDALYVWLESELATVGGDENALGTTEGRAAYTSEGLGLTVSDVERIVITVDGVESSLAAFLGRDALGGGSDAGADVPDGFDYLIMGTQGDDQLTGTDGRDYIVAVGGNNVISGGDGDDEIHGGDGNDRLFGNNGNDVIYGGAGNDVLAGGHGDDVLFGGEGDDALFGGSGNDTLFGESGNDTLFGDDGDDILDGGEGTNYLNGGRGNDVLYHHMGSINTIVGGTGVDTVVISLSSDQLMGGAQDDLAALNDWLAAKLASAGGDESVLANQEGEPALVLSNIGLTVSEVERVVVLLDGEEVDIQEVLNSAPEVASQVEFTIDEDQQMTHDVAAVDPDNDPLTFALAVGPAHGTVEVDGATGHLVYTPNPHFSGVDTFTVVVSDPSGETAEQEVIVNVTPVADEAILTVSDASHVIGPPTPLIGSSGPHVLIGDLFGSHVIPLEITAALVDTDGSETLKVVVDGLPDGATLSAGTVNSDGSVTLMPEELAGLSITVTSAESFELDVTAITNDSGVSTAETSQTLQVTIDAAKAFDDVFIAGSGNGTYIGGQGFDIVDYSLSTKGVTVNLAKNEASGFGKDKLFGIEGVVGSAKNDRIHGDDGDNVIWAGAGNDRVYAGGGDDLVFVGPGNDRYFGGDGFDTLDFSFATGGVTIDMAAGRSSGGGVGNNRFESFESVVGSSHDDVIIGSNGADMINGGDGNDVIRGGRGEDILTGGAGADVFVWETRDLEAGRFDTITDFDASEDMLDFSALRYQGRGAPNDEDRLTLTEMDGGTLVSVDMSNQQGAIEVVFLQGVTDLTGTDWFTF